MSSLCPFFSLVHLHINYSRTPFFVPARRHPICLFFGFCLAFCKLENLRKSQFGANFKSLRQRVDEQKESIRLLFCKYLMCLICFSMPILPPGMNFNSQPLPFVQCAHCEVTVEPYIRKVYCW